MNLAVDSMPLTDDVYRSLDYSGLQIHGLQHRPLHRAGQILGEGREWQVQLGDFTWRDGKPLTPAEYTEGLARAVKAQPYLRSYLVPRLRRVSAGHRRLRFEFSRPVGRGLFQWPNWMPYREGHTSGRFKLQRDWRLAGGGQVHLVSSPRENEELFRAGGLDFTADTAIDLSQVDASVHRRDTGLFGSIIYSKNAPSEKIRSLNQALNGLTFSAQMESVFPSLRPPSPKIRSKAEKFRLSYDAFYPNREICEHIAAHLTRSGWDVELSEDNYYRPQFLGDAKFMILRRPVNDSTVAAHWMNVLPRAGFSRAKIREYVDQCERGTEYDENWVRALELAYPLFRLPSLYRGPVNSENPLLEVFA